MVTSNESIIAIFFFIFNEIFHSDKTQGNKSIPLRTKNESRWVQPAKQHKKNAITLLALLDDCQAIYSANNNSEIDKPALILIK